ncbi:hypothetical protein SAMN05892883_0213 [Jatrophihabitans sp. GAS493]|uniref:hypothetical protein n=1 Tax=Jatrophihabitans sp. GAS493 TaxID=1907575 RepID=UPI000BC082DA|nr:hypothetical protein [Jatrophihabitans sp. GAS493]SOD70522.1 hypothetical protein SAMN05892883_0213 [Jatrophihabitans sp. GAS493]
MTAEADRPLLEAIRIRRGRLEHTFLHGAAPTNRAGSRWLRQLVSSLTLVAVICSGCVATSYVRQHGHRLTSLSPHTTTGQREEVLA